jgi:hypothetical protein
VQATLGPESLALHVAAAETETANEERPVKRRGGDHSWPPGGEQPVATGLMAKTIRSPGSRSCRAATYTKAETYAKASVVPWSIAGAVPDNSSAAGRSRKYDGKTGGRGC